MEVREEGMEVHEETALILTFPLILGVLLHNLFETRRLGKRPFYPKKYIIDFII